MTNLLSRNNTNFAFVRFGIVLSRNIFSDKKKLLTSTDWSLGYI